MAEQTSTCSRAHLLWILTVTSLLMLTGTARGADSQNATGYQQTERLVIRYAEGTFEIVSRTTLQKVLPPSAELPDTLGQVRGYWFEVQSDAGELVYRRRMTPPDVIYTEVPTEEDPDRMSRAEITVSERVFSVLVPKKSKAKSLVFYGLPSGAQKRISASAEIGRVVLR